MTNSIIQEIEQKEFKKKAIGGYDPEEVDIFLDHVCDQIEKMGLEIDGLRSQLNRQPVSATPEPVKTYTPIPAPAPIAIPVQPVISVDKSEEEASESAKKLLSNAQKLYDEIIADAKKEADKILESAHVQSNSGLESLEEKRAELESDIENLKAAAKDYRERFQRLIDDQQHVLKAETVLFED